MNNYRAITDLHEWQDNPRNITPQDFDRLKKQISKLGQYKPLLITDDGEVIGGNMRLKAYRELGIKDIWVSIVQPKDDNEKLEYALSDNDRAGYYDADMLANLIPNYQIDWSQYAVDMKPPEDIQKLIDRLAPVVEDEAPPIAEGDAVSKLGEVYSLGRHRLMCGDSTKMENVETLMDGKKAELLFTSPPYSDMREYEGGKDLSIGNITKFIPVYKSFCNYQVINLGIQRKDQEIVEYWNDYIKIAKESGYKFLAWNVWNKTTVSIGQQKAFIPIYHEWIFVFGNAYKELNHTEKRKTEIKYTNGTKRRQKDGTTRISSLGDQQNLKSIDSVFVSNPEMGIIRKDHPATFPVKLPAEYIQAITDYGDNVIDPFIGSGSTLIACEQTNRTCYGMELDPKYCDVIRKRYAKFIGKEEEWQTITPSL